MTPLINSVLIEAKFHSNKQCGGAAASSGSYTRKTNRSDGCKANA